MQNMAITLVMRLAVIAHCHSVWGRETSVHDLNRPASLEYDPTVFGLWIAHEGPEAILLTLQGKVLRRISGDLFRIKATAIKGDRLMIGDGSAS